MSFDTGKRMAANSTDTTHDLLRAQLLFNDFEPSAPFRR